jgi:hypothetical protein
MNIGEDCIEIDGYENTKGAVKHATIDLKTLGRRRMNSSTLQIFRYSSISRKSNKVFAGLLISSPGSVPYSSILK